jgi:protein subunit release factor B
VPSDWHPGVPSNAADPNFVAPGAPRVVLPRTRLTASFSRSSGAGGQNVNKVNTKADVRFKLTEADWIHEDVRVRLREM